MTRTILSIESLTLDLPPSCTEFCPAHPDYFLVGTYDLEQDEKRASGGSSRPQNRNGSVIIFRLQDRKICCLQTESQPSAVLDLHFQHTEGRKDVLAVASSTATLAIYRLVPSRGAGDLLESMGTYRVHGVTADVLFLACAWHPDIPDLIAVSTSTGAVHIINLLQMEGPDGASVRPVLLHDLEAWTVAFQPALRRHQKDTLTPGEDVRPCQTGDNAAVVTLYSGGDDSKLRYTSCATNMCTVPEKDLQQTPLGTTVLKGHDAGVTAILPLPIQASDGGMIVVTGSYDDHIRVFSIRSPGDTGGPGQARCLAVQNLGGGVWRLKLIRFRAPDGPKGDYCWKASVLASCMHAGVRIVDINGDASGGSQISVVSRFEEHKSMNYGSDIQAGPSPLCISTSFYDKLLCLWETTIA